MTRIHVDISDVVRHAYRHPAVSGVPRVQIEVAREIVRSEPAARVFSSVLGLYEDLTPLLRETLEAPPADLYSALRRRYGRPIGRSPRFRTLGERAENARRQLSWLGRWYGLASPPPAPAFGPGDLVYVGGAFWTEAASLDLYEAACCAGATLVVFLHDVIPITYGAYTSGRARPLFERLLRLPLHVITNSSFSAADIERGRELVGGAPFRSLRVAPLAHEFSAAPRNSAIGPPPTLRLRRLGGRGFALAVGTVEARKNYDPLLQLWTRLARNSAYEFPALVVAGRRGATAGAAYETLRRAGPREAYRFVEAPDDGELAWLYANALFTVFPSLAEGWGLPVGESLWFGKPCVASSATSIPEVGGDLVAYADPRDIETFEPPVRRLVEDGDFHREVSARIRAAPLRSWREVTADIRSAIHEIALGR